MVSVGQVCTCNIEDISILLSILDTRSVCGPVICGRHISGHTIWGVLLIVAHLQVVSSWNDDLSGGQFNWLSKPTCSLTVQAHFTRFLTATPACLTSGINSLADGQSNI